MWSRGPVIIDTLFFFTFRLLLLQKFKSDTKRMYFMLSLILDLQN